MKYRILYDKVFNLSNPIPIKIDEKKYIALSISIFLEYRTFDSNGEEVFYIKKEEKPYDIMGRLIYENDFTVAKIKDDKIIIKSSDIVPMLEAISNQKYQWKIKEWYIDVFEKFASEMEEFSELPDEFQNTPCSTPISVTEEFFNHFVKEHMEQLTNTDNWNAQSCSVGWNEIKS